MKKITKYFIIAVLTLCFSLSSYGVDDLMVYDTSGGYWYGLSVEGGTNEVLVWGQQWGGSGAVPVSGDYDGDWIDDLAVFDDSNGYWYILSCSGELISWSLRWGWEGAVPVSGDYDGDGVDDLALFDNSTGRWYIRNVAGELVSWATRWGWEGAVPVAGDYDGDGVDDLAVFDDNTGNWYIRNVSGEIILWSFQWGWSGAKTVSGDYDGDGQDDLAVFDTNSGYWSIYSKTEGIILWKTQWGWPGAVPVPGDYNGDGVDDLAVYDDVSGSWYVSSVTGEIILWGLSWGWPGAEAVPGNYGETVFLSAPEMILVQSGTFTMGDEWGNGDDDESPTHSVTISEFYAGKYEITNDEMAKAMQWALIRGKITANNATVRNTSGDQKELLNLGDSVCQISYTNGTFKVDSGKGSYPCASVNWYGSVAYCNYLSERKGYTPCYNLTDWSCDFDANGYRLLTEAEWEYAAKGGKNGSLTKYSGSNTIADVAWYSSNSISASHKVGSMNANELGIYDMSGNVWEWCNDWYDKSGSVYDNWSGDNSTSSTYYASSPSNDPTGPSSGTSRVMRGGSWSDSAGDARCSSRFYDWDPDYPMVYSHTGFRVARRPKD